MDVCKKCMCNVSVTLIVTTVLPITSILLHCRLKTCFFNYLNRALLRSSSAVLFWVLITLWDSCPGSKVINLKRQRNGVNQSVSCTTVRALCQTEHVYKDNSLKTCSQQPTVSRRSHVEKLMNHTGLITLENVSDKPIPIVVCLNS